MFTNIDVRFQRVATGLKLIYISLMLTVLMVIGGFVLGFVIAISAAQNAAAGAPGAAAVGVNPMATYPMLLYGTVALGIVVNLIAIFGKISCLNVPEKTQATGPIYVAVALTIIGIILQLGQQFADLPQAVGSISSLVHAGSWFCFLVFLRRLSEFLGDREQAERARTLFTGSIIAGGLFILGIIGTLLAANGAIDKGIVALISFALFGIMIYALVLFVRYAKLVKNLQLHLDRVLVGRALE